MAASLSSLSADDVSTIQGALTVAFHYYDDLSRGARQSDDAVTAEHHARDARRFRDVLAKLGMTP